MPSKSSSQPSPRDPGDHNATFDSEDLELEQALAEVEGILANLKERYAQIQQDKQRKIELKNRIEDVIPQLHQTRSQELKEELKQIKAELETIELNLESRLFGWGSLKEPFWQAVRFGGLGVILGWILNSFAGG